ncbi:Elf1-domain-containing protein [Microstroma glucosiphilum]|uniref:Transcription elongation factor 1 homolog n=1 Tax=Pseudomicrostroma glucosiphilum TaxID=1684307 RepID=A0A316U3R4_9BASI|nr:Elf1-domain-containing protein [Pseudomicrostroma glucosiphilum]PWN19003.1 Elf1-domain-containing protein [Pseudomicrostroma glucosiphilum]
MGKRKSSTRSVGGKKGPQPLDKTFKCLFCSTPNSVSCKIDEKTRIGYLTCKICGQNFSTPTNALSAPIDVYTDWLDACESLNA